ncbi:MAG: primosomal protein N' [Bacteroidetes bacterium]|nr:MAG: primosomal protein N' [Bacteroidota bacterium]
MSRITLFADVLLPLPVKGTFTYRVPYELNDFVQEGQRVAVQFGKKKVYAGLIKKLHEKVPETIPKYILSILDEKPVVNNIQFRFWEWISSYYLSTEGEVMNAALPSAFKLASESKVMLFPGFSPDEHIMDEFEYRVTEALMQKGKLTIDEITKQVGFQKVLPLLKKMMDKRMIYMEEELKGGYKPKLEKMIVLSPAYHPEESLKQLMDELGKRAHKQLECLMTYLTLAGFGDQPKPVAKAELMQKSGSSPAVLKALTDKGVFETEERVVSRFQVEENGEMPPVKLNKHQEQAYEEIKHGFSERKVVLLHGVTSGGKTEIYIKLMEETLRQGKQVLYLLPEIALTTQIITRLRKYFGDQVGVYHSRYSKDERAEVWNHLLGYQLSDDMTRYNIILGPRSAMFLPYDNLGLVIVDEEHDQSYKQFDPAPRYHARDAAVYLSTMHNARVVLGSATPSIESYYNTKQGKYKLVELTERYGGMQMPEIVVVDMREEKRRRMSKSHFSSVLLKEMKLALEEQKQVILFQNRRGFSLRLECAQCAWVPQCKYCDVTLTYHKASELLKCHYCGYSTTIPHSCGECGSTHLKMQGFGTEKVVEELAMIIPEARIDRMDLDSTRTKHAFNRIITDFEDRRTDILIGTQMVTKGLDFDNVRVVGVLSADNMLSFPDFRAHERSFQLMQQVSGRAGRKHERGKVIIQAWKPDHPIIRFVVHHDFEGMYRQQLAERKKFYYPPYYRLIIVKMKHKKYDVLHEGSAVLAKDLRTRFGKVVYGPESPLVGRVRSLYIKHIMIKVARGTNYQKVKDELYVAFEEFRTLAKYKSIVIQFDVDPQ